MGLIAAVMFAKIYVALEYTHPVWIQSIFRSIIEIPWLLENFSSKYFDLFGHTKTQRF
jgi:hypothetical protein